LAAAATPANLLTLPDVGALAAGPEDAPETLLYLHGWGGSKELWWDTLTRLADTHRGVALDLPGTGGTDLPPGLRTMPDMARWVAETCVRLGLARVTLVGHSLGGNLAAQVALDFPALARRLALVDAALDPACLPVRARWPLHGRLGLPALRLMRLASTPLAAAGRGALPDQTLGFWRASARRTHWYAQANRDDRALQRQLQALTDNPLLPARLAALRLPVLIGHGARDAVVPVAEAYALARTLGEARLIVFPTAQHCPMDTDPVGFAQALRDFCRSPLP
jgi:pimeloyl-ACP methyl ester carboxylesterase